MRKGGGSAAGPAEEFEVICDPYRPWSAAVYSERLTSGPASGATLLQHARMCGGAEGERRPLCTGALLMYKVSRHESNGGGEKFAAAQEVDQEAGHL